METQTKTSRHPMLWIAGVAITLFCAAGVAAIMGWIPTSIGQSHEAVVLAPEAPKAKVAVKHAAPPVTRTAAAPAAPAAPVSTPPIQVASAAPTHPRCADCGVIESSREVSNRGEGSGLGAVGGAVVGGLIGNQIGNGSGQKIATVVGAVGGVVAGNEIEKRVKTTKGYEVTVRLNDGSSRVIQQASAPSWRTGDHVKVVDGAIYSN
jgi:outer membrane lipoprotein SlyB